jgi:transcriptional regulator CtsR
LVQGDAAGSRVLAHGYAYAINNSAQVSCVFEILFTPGTTSARTYKVQWLRGGTGNIYINRTHNDTDNATFARCVSTLTVIPH